MNNTDTEQTLTAFFIGRFQPFHLGHLFTVLDLLQRHKFLKIAVGSAQYSGTSKNPYTADTREKMILSSLGVETQQQNYEVFQVPDIPDDKRWVEHLRSIVGEFEVAYTNNDWPLGLLKNAGIDARRQEYIKRETYNGTAIREKLEKKQRWEHLVHKEVGRIIRSGH